MKCRKLLAFLLVLVLCFSLTSCSVIKKEKTTEETFSPLLYKASDKNGNIVWLFGSIHVGEEDFYPLPDYILDAFDASDSLAVEFDVISFEKDFSAQVDALKLLVYTDGTTIEDHLPEDVYDQAKQILKDNDLYNKALDSYCVSLWANLIDNILYERIDADGDLGVDRHLIKRANKKDIEITDIESAELQYGMLAGFSDELQEELIIASMASLENEEQAKKEMKRLIDAWKSGNAKRIEKLLNGETEFEDKQEEKLYYEYNDAMITKRNIFMADFAEDALLSGETVFVCVGTAHVVGKGGIVDLLKQRGYTVEIVK